MYGSVDFFKTSKEKIDMKHAFLIIAHNDCEQIKNLVNALDDRENDIFLHLDRKSSITENDIGSQVKYSEIKIYKCFDIRWGADSQAKCEIFLLREAINNNKYIYYHILSGSDYPIKSMKEIKDFFQNHEGKEFIHFDNKTASKHAYERVLYYHPLNNFYKISKYKFIHRLFFLIDDLCISFQKIFGIQKKCEFKIIQKGCNWCSLSHNFVLYLLDQEEKILRLIKYSECSDEIFIQTIIVNSPYINNLYKPSFDNDYDQCARHIIWDKNNNKYPKTLTLEVLSELRSTYAVFARKFSSSKSSELIDILKKDQRKLNDN